MFKMNYVLAYGFIASIFLLIVLADSGSLTAVIQLIKVVPYYDKYCHFILFGMFSLAANFISGFRVLKVKKLGIYWGSLLVILFALVEEISQAYLPNRTFDLMDLLADGLGVLLFSYVSWRIRGQVNKDTLVQL
jgi:polysaccharide biosynthesis protein VpsQ